MTLEEYIAAIHGLAANDGVAAQESYWTPGVWRGKFENGLSPSDAWDQVRHPALSAL
ncbi:MAG: hypothetical protein ABL894_02395 [Hyphomicrobium sp.]